MTYLAIDAGQPVAVSDSVGEVREFVWHNSGCGEAKDALTHWTSTGKLYLNERWTGWEIKEVKHL